MNQSQSLNLSIGDAVPDHRLTAGTFSGHIALEGKSVRIDISQPALRAISANPAPILAELELYFSCLVRKQVRFRELASLDTGAAGFARVMPGLYTAFRAVTTKECRVADAGGKPPVETMPVKRPGQFVPDWVRIDYRAGRWLGEYGFARNL